MVKKALKSKSKLPAVEPYTRLEIRNMVNNRLKPFGLNMKMNIISETAMKRTLDHIQNSRHLIQNVGFDDNFSKSLSYSIKRQYKLFSSVE